MLGIIIGVGAVIALMSVGEGVESFVTGQFQGLGSNLVFVVPGSLDDNADRQPRPANLTYQDALAIADPLAVQDALAVVPEVSRTRLVVYGKKETYTTVSGVTPEYETVRNFFVEEGEFVTEEAMNGRSRVAVLGRSLAERLFPEGGYPVGQQIRIGKVPFRIVGVMEDKGRSAFNDQGDVIFVPLTTALSRLYPFRDKRGDYRISIAYVQVLDDRPETLDATIAQIETLLRQRHRISFANDDDFTVFSQADVVGIAQDVTEVLTVFLGAIAAISLLVGGIGIMNIMLVSVTERTREIGIRKAVGAKRRDILWQFLIEAMALSLIGGLIGVGLGFLGSRIVAGLTQNIEPVMTIQNVLLATGFAAAVGLFFGIYPATRAAALNPIDALRYE
ncbi:MAG: ABC transporter permease [Anaerolineae bacterium]|nr:MAG: ABC transporter permease [Anaerolineae bacterium]